MCILNSPGFSAYEIVLCLIIFETLFFLFFRDGLNVPFSYRQSRSEVSVDAYHILKNDTLNFLNEELTRCINAGDVCRYLKTV